MRSGRLSTTDRQRTTRSVLLSVGTRIALVTSFELSSSPKHQQLKGPQTAAPRLEGDLPYVKVSGWCLCVPHVICPGQWG